MAIKTVAYAAAMVFVAAAGARASCNDVGENPPFCETGQIVVLAATNNCFKVKMIESKNEYALGYNLTSDPAAVGKIALLKDGAVVSILTTGHTGSDAQCGSHYYIIDKPVRSAGYP